MSLDVLREDGGLRLEEQPAHGDDILRQGEISVCRLYEGLVAAKPNQYRQ